MAFEMRSAGRLADGMVIAASIRAQIFRLRLLRLDADIAITPTPARANHHRVRIRSGESSRTGERFRVTPSSPNNRRIGERLPEVARALEASSAALARSRRSMP